MIATDNIFSDRTPSPSQPTLPSYTPSQIGSPAPPSLSQTMQSLSPTNSQSEAHDTSQTMSSPFESSDPSSPAVDSENSANVMKWSSYKGKGV
jgi:hypothetical protein